MTNEITLLANGWKTCTCNMDFSGPECVLMRDGCVVHDAAADDNAPVGGDDPCLSVVWEYQCLQLLNDGSLEVETLDGVSAGHAYEEALYECEGRTIAVRRGEKLYGN